MKALREAIKIGDRRTVKKLIRNGCKDKIALLMAASSGQTEILRDLVQAGANINWRDKNGYTALSWAKGRGHQSTADVIIELGGKENW